jgi:hypothetical protein
MLLAYIDFETRSSVPIRDGTDRYLTADAEATICTMAINDGPVRCWDILQEPEPAWFSQTLANPHVTYVAHNAIGFDRQVMTRLLRYRTRVDQWLCTRTPSLCTWISRRLGRSVPQPARVGGRCESRRESAHTIILCAEERRHIQPAWEYPNEWEDFKRYACKDVDAPSISSSTTTHVQLYRCQPAILLAGCRDQRTWIRH